MTSPGPWSASEKDDAALIAEAPTLRERLDAVVEALQKWVEFECDRCLMYKPCRLPCKPWKDADAALKKARGGA